METIEISTETTQPPSVPVLSWFTPYVPDVETLRERYNVSIHLQYEKKKQNNQIPNKHNLKGYGQPLKKMNVDVLAIIEVLICCAILDGKYRSLKENLKHSGNVAIAGFVIGGYVEPMSACLITKGH